MPDRELVLLPVVITYELVKEEGDNIGTDSEA